MPLQPAEAGHAQCATVVWLQGTCRTVAGRGGRGGGRGEGGEEGEESPGSPAVPHRRCSAASREAAWGRPAGLPPAGFAVFRCRVQGLGFRV